MPSTTHITDTSITVQRDPHLPWTFQAFLGQQFRSLALLFIFLLLPLCLLFQLDSLLLSLDTFGIIETVAGMILILTATAALLALLISSLTFGAGYAARRMLYSSASRICDAFVAYAFLYAVARAFKVWVETFGYEITVKAVVMAAVAWMILLIATRADLRRRLWELEQSILRPLIIILVLSAGLVAWQSANTYLRHRAAGVAPRQTQAAAKPNLILITFDALSAEDMSLYGYPLNTTPNIDAFSHQSYVFDNAFAASNWTRPSVGSLLTGRYPDRHRLINTNIANNACLHPEQSLPAVLKNSGYENYALVANLGFAHPLANGLSPYFTYQPFRYADANANPKDSILNLFWIAYRICDLTGNRSAMLLASFVSDMSNKLFSTTMSESSSPWYPPELVFDDAIRTLDRIREQDRSRPFFIWTHVMPPHYPYLPGKNFLGTFLPGDEFSTRKSTKSYDVGGQSYDMKQQQRIAKLRLRYNENILYADDAFGKYIKELRSRGLLENSVVIVSADHGESFSHGYQGHLGSQLYQPLVHIPLLVHLPGQTQHTRVASTVSQTDITPTLLGLAGISIPGWIEGRKLELRPESHPADATEQPIYTMNLEGSPVYGTKNKGSQAVVTGGFKYIYNAGKQQGELFDLASDPQESRDLTGSQPETAARLKELIIRRFGSATP